MDDFEEVARNLARHFSTTSAKLDRTGELPRENLQRAVAAGVLGLTVPRELGGLGADLHQFARYQERLARGDGATALILAMHHMLIGGEGRVRPLAAGKLRRGVPCGHRRQRPDQRRRHRAWCREPFDGGLPKSVAELEEPAEGQQTLPATWRISGRKAYTTGAPALAFMRVSARVQPAGGEPYGARFLVRMPASGVSIEPGWEPAGLGAAASHTVIFNRTPATFLYREDRRGCEGTVWFHVAVAATYLGIGQAAYEAGRDYVRARPAGGGEGHVSDIESVRLRLGRSRGELMVARRNLFATCAEWVDLPGTRKQDLAGAFALAKVTAVNAAASAAGQAVRLAGAGGLDRALPMERFLRETRAGLAHPPVDDVAYLALAREELESN